MCRGVLLIYTVFYGTILFTSVYVNDKLDGSFTEKSSVVYCNLIKVIRLFNEHVGQLKHVCTV